MARSHTVDIGGLLAGGRQLMLVDDEVPIESFEGIAFPQPARVRLELRFVDRMLVIAGTIDARASGECDSCLDEVERDVHVDVDERLDPSSGREERAPAAGGKLELRRSCSHEAGWGLHRDQIGMR